MEPLNVLKMKAKSSPGAEMPILDYGPCSACWWAREGQGVLRCFVDPPHVVYHPIPERHTVDPKKGRINFALQGARPTTYPDDTCSRFLDRRLVLRQIEKTLKEEGKETLARILHSSAPQSPLPPPLEPGQGLQVARDGQGGPIEGVKDEPKDAG